MDGASYFTIFSRLIVPLSKPVYAAVALFFAISLIAQWMMARKYVECWLIWVAVNCIAVPFFLLRQEYPTMFQYAVFLVLAVMGWRQWKASLAASS